MSDIPSLIEALEKAQGPSGMLDVEIYKLCWLGKISPGTIMEYRLDHDGFGMRRCKHEGQDWGGWWHVERYTASVDAARSLAEDGVEFSTTNLYGVAMVEVGLNMGDDFGGTITVRRMDGNLILAECEAWLRLRAALLARSAG